MRDITFHKIGVSPLDQSLHLRAMDEPDPVTKGTASYAFFGRKGDLDQKICPVKFQEGDPVKGVNGVTAEGLLALLIDRLKGLQEGPYACTENSHALAHLHEALFWLQARQRDRAARGVLGKREK